MTIDGLIWQLLVGLIAGWLAGRIMKGKGFGLLGDLIIGVLGAVIGRWAFGLLGIGAWGPLGSIVIALAGALLLLYLVRILKQV